MDIIVRSKKERVFHAVCYEILAIALTAPVLALIMHTSVFSMGFLTAIISCLAMLLNMIFNYLFDSAQNKWQFTRTAKVRFLHGALFEVGIIVFTIPVVAWYLSVDFITAFFLESGLIAFYLPYTIGYNWVYDKLRDKYMLKKKSKC